MKKENNDKKGKKPDLKFKKEKVKDLDPKASHEVKGGGGGKSTKCPPPLTVAQTMVNC